MADCLYRFKGQEKVAEAQIWRLLWIHGVLPTFLALWIGQLSPYFIKLSFIQVFMTYISSTFLYTFRVSAISIFLSTLKILISFKSLSTLIHESDRTIFKGEQLRLECILIENGFWMLVFYMSSVGVWICNFL